MKSYSCLVQILTFAASDDRYVTRARTAIKNDRFLYPGDEEVGTFSYHCVLDPTESVKDNGSVACIDCGRNSGLTIIISLKYTPSEPSL